MPRQVRHLRRSKYGRPFVAGSGRIPEKGYTYREAKTHIRTKLFKLGRHSTLRVTYGTRTGKFYFILPDDRDYKHFSVSLQEFYRAPDKNFVKDLILRPSVWR